MKRRARGVKAPTMMTLAEAHALVTRTLPAAVLVGDGGVELSRVHSDTRSLRAGDLFVALRGERFDGHDYLPQARAAGAVAALAERGLAEAGLPGMGRLLEFGFSSRHHHVLYDAPFLGYAGLRCFLTRIANALVDQDD